MPKASSTLESVSTLGAGTMTRTGWLLVGSVLCVTGCGVPKGNEADGLTYADAVQRCADEQRELDRLLEERTRHVQAQVSRVDVSPSTANLPRNARLESSRIEPAALDDVRLDLGPAQAEIEREADEANRQVLKQLDCRIVRQRHRLLEARSLKDSIDN